MLPTHPSPLLKHTTRSEKASSHGSQPWVHRARTGWATVGMGKGLGQEWEKPWEQDSGLLALMTRVYAKGQLDGYNLLLVLPYIISEKRSATFSLYIFH